MIKDQVIPNIEQEPSYYSLYYKYDNVRLENGTRASSALRGMRCVVAYTYEGALHDLQEYVEGVCKDNGWKYYGGAVEVIYFQSNTINGIFAEAHEKFGEPEEADVKVELEPELLCEDK